MKNTMKIRMIGAAALLGIGASAFPSLAAAKIQQLSVYINGIGQCRLELSERGRLCGDGMV